LSIGLHLLAAGLCWWGFTQFSPAEVTEPPEIDTRVGNVDEPTIEVSWIDVDVAPPRRPAPKPQPPSVAPTTDATPSPPAAPAPIWSPAAPAPAVPAGNASAGESTGHASGATTSFFEVPSQGRSVVYVIDRSCSMGEGGRLERARRELLASLGRLPATARFQIIAYNRHAESLSGSRRAELLPATDENKVLAARFLAGLVAEGSTGHAEALHKALFLQADVIYFLTDADDLQAADVHALTQLNRGRSTIHTIELSTAHRDRPEMPMHVLAQSNRGRYQAVDLLASGGR
jgi:hypothetical protein